MSVKKSLVLRGKIIEKGAPVISDSNDNEDKKWKNILLRLPLNLVQKMDKILESEILTSRTSYIANLIKEDINKKEIQNED